MHILPQLKKKLLWSLNNKPYVCLILMSTHQLEIIGICVTVWECLSALKYQLSEGKRALYFPPMLSPMSSPVLLGSSQYATNICWMVGSTTSNVYMFTSGNGHWTLSTHLDLLSFVFYHRNCKGECLWLSTIFLMLLSANWLGSESPGVFY